MFGTSLQRFKIKRSLALENYPLKHFCSSAKAYPKRTPKQFTFPRDITKTLASCNCSNTICASFLSGVIAKCVEILYLIQVLVYFHNAVNTSLGGSILDASWKFFWESCMRLGGLPSILDHVRDHFMSLHRSLEACLRFLETVLDGP